jgi:LPS-assembly protein
MIASQLLCRILIAALVCAPVLVSAAEEPDQPGCAVPTRGHLMPMLAAATAAPMPSLRPPGLLKRSDDVKFQADNSSTDFVTNQSILTGHVDVHMGDRELQADQLTHDNDSSNMNAEGHVRFSNPIVMVQGDTGYYGEEGALFNHAQFQFQKEPGYGSADQFAWAPNNVITVRNVIYTSCPPPHADWRIRARELRLDTAAGEGVGRNARLEVEGIPILYLPWISFPLSDARKSGFLFPEFSTSTPNGVTVATPWYWNIAPSQDATFTPTIYALRGVDLGAQYRFLSATNAGTISGNFLPDDQRQREADRSYVRLLDRWNLPVNTRVDLNYENVSDTQYFEDFSQGTESTSTPFLPRSVSISHRDEIWNLRAQLRGYQTLDTVNLIEYQRPYLELPRVTAAGLWSPEVLPRLNFSFDSEVVNFTRSCGFPPAPATSNPSDPIAAPPPISCPDFTSAEFPLSAAVSGWRLNARPQVALDVSGPGYFFRPSAALDLTRYQLHDAQYQLGDAPYQFRSASDFNVAPQRTLPIVDIDTGLQFERMTGANDGRSMTFEPRLMYVYIPYRDQNHLPVFDTDTPDLNTIELFRPNRFVGIDRIGDSNSLTVGATTQWFDNASGTRYLSATLAQAFYLQPPQVTAPDETLPPRTTSSMIAEINLTAYRHWNIQADVASSPTVSRIEQAEVMTQYLANNKQVINIGYLYRSGVLQQVDGSVAYPVSRHWDVYARAVYSLRSAPAVTTTLPSSGTVVIVTPPVHPGSIEDFAGFQYRGSCWSVRAVAQHSISTRTGQSDTGVSFQVELTGLSNVGNGVGTGSGVSTFLEQSIRGYSASANKP